MTKARDAAPTVAFIDEYCAQYRSVFHNVRHFEQFTPLELGLLAETKRKSLPRLAKTVQADPQALHHFLANAEWSVEELRAMRLRAAAPGAAGAPFILCIDETGDRKKGKTTDYAAHQYIGNLHTLANGVVSVNAYGVLGTVTFPLPSASSSPGRASSRAMSTRASRSSRSSWSRSWLALGFRFSVVLADSLYGESGEFIARLAPAGAALRGRDPLQPWGLDASRASACASTRWRPFERVFTDGSSEQRYPRETVFGPRRAIRYFQITTDPSTCRPRRPGTS